MKRRKPCRACRALIRELCQRGIPFRVVDQNGAGAFSIDDKYAAELVEALKHLKRRGFRIHGHPWVKGRSPLGWLQ